MCWHIIILPTLMLTPELEIKNTVATCRQIENYSTVDPRLSEPRLTDTSFTRMAN